MLSADALDRVDREISFLRRASWSGWGKVPDYAGPRALVPDMAEGRALRPAHDDYEAALIERAVQRAREYVQQQNALDAPFQDSYAGEAHHGAAGKGAG
jgi:hypothetical protein